MLEATGTFTLEQLKLANGAIMIVQFILIMSVVAIAVFLFFGETKKANDRYSDLITKQRLGFTNIGLCVLITFIAVVRLAFVPNIFIIGEVVNYFVIILACIILILTLAGLRLIDQKISLFNDTLSKESIGAIFKKRSKKK